MYVPVHLLDKEGSPIHFPGPVSIHPIVVLDPASRSVLLLLQLPISGVVVLNQECCVLLPVLDSR